MLKDGTDVRLDSAFQVVIKHHHLVDDQIQVLAFQLAFFQDVLEHIDGGFDHLVDLDDEVSLVRQQVNLVVGPSIFFCNPALVCRGFLAAAVLGPGAS